MRTRVVMAALLAVAALAGAQGPRRGPDPAELEAMKKFDFLVGRWEGKGWIQAGPDRKVEFEGSESVQRKLQGRVLLVEGDFTSEIEGQRVPVHQTLAVISRDMKEGVYRFRTYLLSGGSGDNEIQLLESPPGFQWSPGSSGGNVRFTTTVEDGEWIEVGERSRDGQSWTKFFEMRLKKTREAGQ